MKKQWKLSATMLNDFKTCPYRTYLKYVCGIIPEEETDALRMGTNWHRVLEIISMKPGSVCPDCCKTQKQPDCPLCEGTDILPDDTNELIARVLNAAYADKPDSKTTVEWEAERAILLYSAIGYLWHWEDDEFEVVAEEVPFKIPLLSPTSGRKLPNVAITGKIDKISRSPLGIYYIDEHKSTGKDISPDSRYWSHLKLDLQTTLYPYAARRLQLNGDLEDYGITADDPLISGVRYDAWHKPGIRPKKLTQAESKKFVETGEYMDQEFKVTGTIPGNIRVDEELAEIELGKKEGTFAIRETASMYGARVLADIVADPNKFFYRKEVGRTDADIEKFERELYSMYQAIKFIDRNNGWWHCEKQCEATYRCPYTEICYNGLDVTENVPNGFINMYEKGKYYDCKRNY